MQMMTLPVTSLCWNEFTRSGVTFLIVLDPEQVRQTSDPPHRPCSLSGVKQDYGVQRCKLFKHALDSDIVRHLVMIFCSEVAL